MEKIRGISLARKDPLRWACSGDLVVHKSISAHLLGRYQEQGSMEDKPWVDFIFNCSAAYCVSSIFVVSRLMFSRRG